MFFFCFCIRSFWFIRIGSLAYKVLKWLQNRNALKCLRWERYIDCKFVCEQFCRCWHAVEWKHFILKPLIFAMGTNWSWKFIYVSPKAIKFFIPLRPLCKKKKKKLLKSPMFASHSHTAQAVVDQKRSSSHFIIFPSTWMPFEFDSFTEQN